MPYWKQQGYNIARFVEETGTQSHENVAIT